MDNKVQDFLTDKFGEVRAVKEGNMLYFVAGDIAKSLKYATTQKVTDKVDEEDILKAAKNQLPNFGNWSQTGGKDVILINEGGLYQVIASISKKDKERYELSREFKRWITNEVIPTIRETGGYVEEEREDEFIHKYFPSFSEDVKLAMVQDLLKTNKELKVKASNWDQFLDSKSTYTFTEVAKMISTKASEDSDIEIKISSQALTKYLRNNGILSKVKSGNKYTNVPNKEYEEYFNVFSRNVREGFDTVQTKVKSNGVEFIYNSLKQNEFNVKAT